VAGLFVLLSLHRTHKKPAGGNGYDIGGDHLSESKTGEKFVNEYGGSVSNTFLKGKEGVFGAPDCLLKLAVHS
jgi:hypothetical protein